ncbi:LysR substrate-binding domain-containing protein [Neptuniibacter sp. QD48_11]|uniref:LysR substrate-binding domain-containing protein n=1 Tax=unclassified Neptuniibacter TaxID=2630693 RepID=UPI0039F4DD82
MDQFHLMNVFVAVAEEQGFAAASRRLNISPPAVTRAVSALEEKLGIKLLTRTTRHVRTTDAGQRYLQDAQRILQELERANESAIGINSEPKGHLSVTAPVLFGQKYVMPSIAEYLNNYPETEVDAVFLDRVVNLMEEGFDVGIRIGHLPDSNMYAKRVGTVRMHWLASSQYLEKAGIPQSPEDLKQHSTIMTNSSSMVQDWKFDYEGKQQSLRLKPRLTVSTNQSAINAAKLHLGIIHTLSYQVEDELNHGELKTVLENYEPPAMPVHIVHREGRQASSKIRSFIDILAKTLNKNKTIN